MELPSHLLSWSTEERGKAGGSRRVGDLDSPAVVSPVFPNQDDNLARVSELPNSHAVLVALRTN